MTQGSGAIVRGKGWVLRSAVEQDLLRSLRRVHEPIESELRRIAGYCACCHRNFRPERIERFVCAACREHCTCNGCGQPVKPSEESFGRACATCWANATEPSQLSGRLIGHTRTAVLRELHRLAFGEGPCH